MCWRCTIIWHDMEKRISYIISYVLREKGKLPKIIGKISVDFTKNIEELKVGIQKMHELKHRLDRLT